MPRWLVLAMVFVVSACGSEEEEATSAEPAAPTFDLVIEVDAPVTEAGRSLTERALRGLPLSFEGGALGELGTIRPTVFGARFQARVEPGEHTFTARAQTPCGPREVPIATWTITESQVRGSSFMGPASERFALGYDDLTVRHVYVIGGDAQTTVHVGEVELPAGTGPHVVFSHGCEEAPVRVGTETIGTWRPSGPTIVNLEPAACQRYEVRTLSASGYAPRRHQPRGAPAIGGDRPPERRAGPSDRSLHGASAELGHAARERGRADPLRAGERHVPDGGRGSGRERCRGDSLADDRTPRPAHDEVAPEPSPAEPGRAAARHVIAGLREGPRAPVGVGAHDG